MASSAAGERELAMRRAEQSREERGKRGTAATEKNTPPSSLQTRLLWLLFLLLLQLPNTND